MIDGSKLTETPVELKMSVIALKRAFGATAEELANEYGLSKAVMVQALEDMGMIKHRGTEVGDIVKDKFEIVANIHELTVEEIRQIIVECGYKLPTRGVKRYTIIHDIVKEGSQTSEEPEMIALDEDTEIEITESTNDSENNF